MSSDSSSIAAAFIEQRTALERFLVRRTGSEEAGRDLLQETWIRVHQTQPSQNIERPVAYLFRMAGNVAIDWLRKTRATARHLSDEPIPDTVPCTAPGPEQAAQTSQEFDALCAAIRDLPPKCREVFCLYRGEGLAMSEIALRLEISEKTVEHHIAKAMVHCRRRLQEAGRAV